MRGKIGKVFLSALLVMMQSALIWPQWKQPLAAQSIPVPNNSFEEYLDFWETNGSSAIRNGTGWSPPGGGNVNLNYWSEEDYEADTYQTITGLEEGEYTLSAWAARGGEFNDIHMYAQDGDEEPEIVPIPNNGNWTQFSLTIKVTSGSLKIGFYASAKGGAWANIDLVELTLSQEEDSDKVQIMNSDFEEDGGQTDTITGWDELGDTSASFAGGPGYNSNYALTHWADHDYEVRTYQQLNDLENGYYTLTAWAQTGGGQEAIYLFGGGTGRSEARTAIPIKDGWTKVHVRGIEVTDGTAVIGLHSKAAAGAWAKIDRVELVKEDQPYRLLKGGDVSELTHVESRGGVFYDRDGNPKDLFLILKENGHDIVRLRVYNDPGKGRGNGSYYRPEGIMNKEDILHLARRAKAAGLQIQLTFHYSDYWTNGATQIIPHEWREAIEELSDEAQIVSRLAQLVYDYTKDVMLAMVDQGTTPEFVSLGNEMQDGILFPYGRAAGANWAHLATFLKAGYQAVKEVSPSSRVVLHLDDAGNYGKYVNFFDKMEELGVEYDVIGPSYYPFWTNKTVEEAVAFFNYISDKYDKDILVMETGYKWNATLPNGDAGQLTHNGPYPNDTSTPEGQKNFMIDLFNGLKSSGNGRVIGDLYWDPIMIAVPGVGWAIREADDQPDVNVVSNTTLFDFEGKLLPVHDAYLYNTEGRTDGMISGVVRGVDGRGIARATVHLNVDEDTTYTVFTDKWGNYLLPSVPPGKDYTITASKAGYSSGTATVSELGYGEHASRVNILVTGGKITGTVRDDKGHPASGATVTLTAGEDTFTTTADEQGAYTLHDIPAGSGYVLVAAKPGYTESSVSRVSVTIGMLTEADDLVIALNSGTIAGTVTTEEGHPIPGATVSVAAQGQTLTAVTSATGAYEIENVPAGTGYVVTAAREHYESASVSGVSVAIGQRTEGVDIVLLSSLGAISGQVTNSSNESVAGAEVVAAKGDATYTATTDAEGRYTIDSVPAGSDYTLRASASGYLDGVASGISVRARKTTERADIRLMTPVAIRNHGFETRVESDRTIIPEWDVESTKNATYIQYHAQATDGNYVLSTWLEQPYVSDVSQTLTGLDNGYYRLSAWFYNGGLNEHYMYAKDHGGDKVRIDIPATSGMVQFSLQVEVTSGQLTIGFYSDGNTGNWTNIDEVQLGYLGVSLPEPPIDPEEGGGEDDSGGDEEGGHDDDDSGGGNDDGEEGDDNSGGNNGGDNSGVDNGSDNVGSDDHRGSDADRSGESDYVPIDLLKELEAAEAEKVVVVELQAEGERAAASLSAEHIAHAYDQGIERIVLRSDIAEITISAAWLAEQLKGTAGHVELSMAKADKSRLPEHVQEQLGEHDAYEFRLSMNGEYPSSFGAGSVLVSFPYAPGSGEEPHLIVVYYIDEEGRWEPVPNSVYDEETGMVRFAARHFSLYAAKHAGEAAKEIPAIPWASRAIGMLAARGVIDVHAAEHYEPLQPIKRGEFAAMLAAAFGLEAGSHEASFTDVDASSPWHDAIVAAEAHGIVKGVGGGRFAPNDPITRQDMAVMIVRLAFALEIDLPETRPQAAYRDEQDIAGYAREAVETLLRASVMQGTGSGEFQPLRRATRAEAAVIIGRLLELMHRQWTP